MKSAGFLGTRFPDMPCIKRVCQKNEGSVDWSTARNEERFSSRRSTADKRVVNRPSTASFVLVSVFNTN